MNHSQIQDVSSKLIASLWQQKYLPTEHPLVHPYIEEQEVRNCVRRLSENWGLKVAREGKHIHLLVQPGRSVLNTPMEELRRSIKGYDSETDLYLMGVIWLVIYNEADNELSTTIKWENEGLTYGEIEDLVNQVMEHWNKLNEESDNQFSKDWSLAVTRMYKKWKVLRYNKTTKGRVVYAKDSRIGLIDTAARELEKDKMVFIERTAQMSRVTPMPVFRERLKLRFGNLDKYQDRYELLKVLLEDVKESGEVSA
ncbi:DUF6063 family protein [Anaerobacillus isosaccharinicus]|uniref:DUF6063 family protein n=1 Tax=Anaerobacillus isosaccharinicus TaxID=1532552 RepID=A0A7S7RE46_9BACI|nr:DUF6063 family protein [Anaerobacillus isosaccharinicus]